MILDRIPVYAQASPPQKKEVGVTSGPYAITFGKTIAIPGVTLVYIRSPGIEIHRRHDIQEVA